MSGAAGTGLRPEEEDGERGDMAFLKELLSPGPGGSDEFSKEWQDAFGMFDSPSAPPPSTGAASSGPAASSGSAARPPSNPPSPTGFLPSQLLDHSLSSAGQSLCTLLEDTAHRPITFINSSQPCFVFLGWSTPPMFQAPPLQPPSGQTQSAQTAPSSAANGMLVLNLRFCLYLCFCEPVVYIIIIIILHSPRFAVW